MEKSKINININPKNEFESIANKKSKECEISFGYQQNDNLDIFKQKNQSYIIKKSFLWSIY